jgi:signal transduction histidine kinase
LFTNLIGNGIKFRKPDATPVITIDASIAAEEEVRKHKLAGDTSYYKIKVADNGIGFNPEYAAQIFQMFQRLHGKSEYPGSGIGLAICKKIADYHNGTIFAESIPGEGACFIILLPQRQINK